MANGGKPARAKNPIAMSTAVVGATRRMPLILFRSRVPYFMSTLPEMQNSSALVKPCVTQCRSAAAMPSGPPKPKHKATMPMFSQEWYASLRLRSSCENTARAAMPTEIAPKMSMTVCGKVGPTAWMARM